MFGLEDQKKKKKVDVFLFDLERDLKKPEKQKELKDKIDARIQEIKSILKKGESKEDFDKFGILLHGYTSLFKVMARCLK